MTAKSNDLKYVAVASGNGTVQVIRCSDLGDFGVSQRHDMVIKGIDFVGNGKVVSGTPECSYHVQKVVESTREEKMFWIVLVLLVVGILGSWVVEGEL